MRSRHGPAGRRAFIGAGVMLAAAAWARAAAPAACGNECDDVSAWSRYTSIELALRFPGQPDHAAWHFQLDRARNDIRVDVDQVMEDKVTRGTVGMVAGRTLVVKDLDVVPGHEIDALDGPVLTMRLVLGLLARTLPGGPDSVTGDRAIDFNEAKTGIRYGTPSASGHIAAPWRASGHVARSKDDVVTYDLHLTGEATDPLGNKSGPVDMILGGKLRTRPGPVFDETMSLADWKVYGAGAKAASGTIADVRAASRPGGG
ncbi:MAG TPA: hypothetical protein VFE23_06645 [Usitatibacter sp.]|jgi:hypothetical protein|nr:hypothetical protein [Usitatibacter sp.]